LKGDSALDLNGDGVLQADDLVQAMQLQKLVK
jgi:hypothetical protein